MAETATQERWPRFGGTDAGHFRHGIKQDSDTDRPLSYCGIRVRWFHDEVQRRPLCGNCMAAMGVVGDPWASGSSPCAGDPCTCANGIGCVNVPIEEW